MLVGFHGYAEDAEVQLERLRAIPGSDRWGIVSIQALHRFYQRRTNTVVASWMTRQNRDEAIADNAAYVSACLDAVASEWTTLPVVVFAGFSQGVAMAFRAAAGSARHVASVMAVGGDVPPEIAPGELKRVSAALIARGTADVLYPEEQFIRDQQRLRECSVNVRAVSLEGGHGWPGELTAEASRFLQDCLSKINRF